MNILKYQDFVLESKLFGMSTSEYLAHLKSLQNLTWIWFDTETTGLKYYVAQLTEIAAISTTVNLDNTATITEIDKFHQKIKLNDDVKKRIQDVEDPHKISAGPSSKDIPHPHGEHELGLIKMTRYGEPRSKNIIYNSEQIAIDDFKDWLDEYNNLLLVAQNVKFDTKMINKRSQYPILNGLFFDLKMMIFLYWIPIQQTLADNGDQNAIQKVKKMTKTYPDGRQSVSGSLGVVAKALNVNPSGWHSAVADIELMLDVFKLMYQDLIQYQDLDIRQYRVVWVKKAIKYK